MKSFFTLSMAVALFWMLHSCSAATIQPQVSGDHTGST